MTSCKPVSFSRRTLHHGVSNILLIPHLLPGFPIEFLNNIMFTVFVFHILVTHQTHRCLLISLTCQYLAFVKNLSVPRFVFVKSKIAPLFHGFKVQIFCRAICVQTLTVHVIPTNKSVTLHVLYSYYSTEMHKTGVS